MSEHQKELSWKERMRIRLNTNYRLVVINDNTFEEVKTYYSNLRRLIIIGIFMLFSISCLTALFFLFSPIRQYFKGYINPSGTKLMQLEQQITQLESELRAQQLLQDNIRKVMIGQFDTTGTGHNTALIAEERLEDSVNIERISLDEQLRKNIQSQQAEKVQVSNINLPPSDTPLGQRFFSPPITGEMTKSFDPLSKHYGVDIIAPQNTAIKCALDGYVISADWNLETGNTICVQHKGSVVTFYKHNSALLKKVGDIVQAGEAIAIIGDTGDHSTGPHLHFEIWHKGIPVDPADYVNFN